MCVGMRWGRNKKDLPAPIIPQKLLLQKEEKVLFLFLWDEDVSYLGIRDSQAMKNIPTAPASPKVGLWKIEAVGGEGALLFRCVQRRTNDIQQ